MNVSSFGFDRRKKLILSELPENKILRSYLEFQKTRYSSKLLRKWHEDFISKCVLYSSHELRMFFLIPVDNYMFKVRAKCEICSKLTIKIPEQDQWCCSGVFSVNFEHISHLFRVFLLLPLSK